MDTIVTLASVPAVIALTTLFKTVGMTGRWATLTAVLLGLILTVLSRILPPDTWGMVSDGLILGLSAAGLYDIKRTPPALDEYTPERAL